MKKKKRQRTNKEIYVYAAVAVAIAIVAFSAIQQYMMPARAKFDAADYFETTDGIILDADLESSNDQNLYLLQVGFNLTAVGGDAHHVLITASGMVEMVDWPYFSEMRQNEAVSVTMPRFQFSVRCRKNIDGYFEFVTSLDCDEARGRITVLLQE